MTTPIRTRSETAKRPARSRQSVRGATDRWHDVCRNGQVREGRAGEAAAAYSHHGRVRRSTNPSELIGDMVERWWVAREFGDDAVLYAYARDVVRVLNGLARRHVEVAGRLSGPELTVKK